MRNWPFDAIVPTRPSFAMMPADLPHGRGAVNGKLNANQPLPVQFRDAATKNSIFPSGPVIGLWVTPASCQPLSVSHATT